MIVSFIAGEREHLQRWQKVESSFSIAWILGHPGINLCFLYNLLCLWFSDLYYSGRLWAPKYQSFVKHCSILSYCDVQFLCFWTMNEWMHHCTHTHLHIYAYIYSLLYPIWTQRKVCLWHISLYSDDTNSISIHAIYILT